MDATSMNPGLLMMLGDARLPTGGHSHSAGLEPALLAGLDPAEIPAFIDARLRTAVLVDASAAVVARSSALAGSELDEVVAAWAARTPSPVSRASALTLGRGVQRLLRRLWPTHQAVALLDAVELPYRPIALGALAAAAGVTAYDTAVLVCHDDVSAITGASLKLAPGDPVEATGWLLAAQHRVAEVAGRAAEVAAVRDMPAPTAPLAECWTQAHATRERRLFSA